MNLLHLSNDYSGSTIYKNLVKNLDYLQLSQTVYTPVRSKELIDRNNITFDCLNSKIIYSFILNRHTDRLFYKCKIKKILRDLTCKVDISQFNIIHAHTWYSDGGVAYELYKKYKINYIVAVRNTDINLFYKYLHYLRGYGKEILLNATKIVFITPVYYKRFVSLFSGEEFYSKIKDKTVIIPNGIDDFWIKNIKKRKIKVRNPVELLYIGNFSSNKNVERLLKAVEFLNRNSHDFNLKIVGTGGSKQKKILKKIQNKSCFSYLGHISNLDALQSIFNDSDIFTMPSKTETFGLVYIEAISQGLTVLYSKNEGIDQLYDNIGESVNPYNINDIADSIHKISNNYSNYIFDPAEILKNHDWEYISNQYFEIYESMCFSQKNI